MKNLKNLRGLVLLALTSATVLAGAKIPLETILHDYSLDGQTRLDAYDAALAEYAARPGASFTGPDAALEAELARIGRDRQARPELYARMLHRYTRESRNTRAGGAPYPKPEEVTEAYRLAWEYLLLRPYVDGDVGAHTARAISALTGIASEASVPVLVLDFDKDAEYKVGTSNIHQQTILGALAGIPTARSLEAIVECAAAVERQLQKVRAQIEAMPDRIERMNAAVYLWSPVDEAARIGAPGADPRWTAVLAAYRSKDADPLKARILTQARQTRMKG